MTRMRWLRLEGGMSLADLSAKTKIAPGDLSRAERKLLPLFPDWQRRLAGVLDCPARDLLKEVGERQARQATEKGKERVRSRRPRRMNAAAFAKDVGDVTRAVAFMEKWAGWRLPTEAEFETYLKTAKGRAAGKKRRA